MKNLIDTISKAKEEGSTAIHKLVDVEDYTQVIATAQILSLIENAFHKLNEDYKRIEVSCKQLIDLNKTIPVPRKWHEGLGSQSVELISPRNKTMPQPEEISCEETICEEEP